MTEKLSIIIPCYNCEDTVREAVNSCFGQGLSDFEIIMVNDGSTDNTLKVLEEIKKEYSNVKIIDHPFNKGGGAARNTAVKNTSNDIIFCLDSDDLLPPNTLSKMFTFLIEKQCDGVGVHKSIKFNTDNINNVIGINEFGYSGKKIPVESLIEKKGQPLCPLYSVFMFTKKAFEIAGGYPEDHGFDTQGFAWRFLLSGLNAYTCPNTSYLHRVNYNESYYLREYNSGRINLNWQLVLREFISAFSEGARQLILNKSVNDYENIIDELKKINEPWNKNLKEKIVSNSLKKDSALINGRYPFSPSKTISRNSLHGILIRINNKIKNKFRQD